ncbi:hypothetical protein [Furfurilactobacillus curtus]|uniref:Bacteriocin immunity protein n=1 Tax=Furfurilactobacillus curtus TaxID=1746200 RepID=A0ABQ5JPS3_9LACO
MNEDKKIRALQDVNQLLNDFYQSLPLDQIALQQIVSVTYKTINEPDKLAQQYRQVPEAIARMNKAFERIALLKQYHFTKQQAQILAELNNQVRQAFQYGWIGLIDMPIWFQ